MAEYTLKEEILSIFQTLPSNLQITPREIFLRLGISLGKVNYLIKELAKKGIIKIENFLIGKHTRYRKNKDDFYNTL